MSKATGGVMNEKRTVNIKDLGRADVLRALYANARPQGLGLLHYTPGGMSQEEAMDLLKEYNYFDYVHGRVMKVDLREGTEELRVALYDRDNGQGAALAALQPLITLRDTGRGE